MTYSNHCSKEKAYSCQSFKANLSILWLVFWPMPYQYTLSQDLQQSSTEYIEQVSLEANLVARLLEITQEKFNTSAHPEHEKLSFQVSKLQNKTRRLSDNFLDFDLLDTQARKVLGFIKPNEIIIN